LEIPDILKLLIDQGIGKFLHDQIKMTFPPGAYIEIDLSPPDPDLTWVTFALTFGNIKEDSLDVWHRHSQMKYHRDPMWYSLGIGPSFVYPLWIYATQSEPHLIEIENITDTPQTADVMWWMVEVTPGNMDKFRRVMQGRWNELWAWGGKTPEQAAEIRQIDKLRLYSELYPEFKKALKEKQKRDVMKLAKELGLKVELK